MPTFLLTLTVHFHTRRLELVDYLDVLRQRILDRYFVDGRLDGGRLAGSAGQATTEYALVLLAAAMVALLVIAWASAGGGAAKISRLFNKVIDSVINRV
jgi:hypothetical protein